MTPEELATRYPLIAEQVSATAPAVASLTAETFSQDGDVRRFFRRLGILPRGARKAPASKTILSVVDRVSKKAGADGDEARAVLAAYCRSDGGLQGLCGKSPQCDQCPLAEQCEFFSRKPTIKQLPEAERPRERLASLGPGQLTDAELLAIIIGGGTEALTAVDLARNLLVRFGGLRELAGCSPTELQKMNGIGQARSVGIKAALELGRRVRRQPPEARPGAFLNAETVFARYGPRLGPEKRETFVALLLDIKNRLIRDVTISQGSLNQSIVHPREVFQPAIRDSAASVIFVHNHPSGDTTPSREDREITRRLKQTGDVIGIRVLDHVIVGEHSYTSFANDGLLDA